MFESQDCRRSVSPGRVLWSLQLPSLLWPVCQSLAVGSLPHDRPPPVDWSAVRASVVGASLFQVGAARPDKPSSACTSRAGPCVVTLAVVVFQGSFPPDHGSRGRTWALSLERHSAPLPVTAQRGRLPLVTLPTKWPHLLRLPKQRCPLCLDGVGIHESARSKLALLTLSKHFTSTPKP